MLHPPTSALSLQRDGSLYRIDDGVVAGASAHVAGNEFPDFGARRCLAARQELVGGQQHAGRAEGALCGVTGDELRLQPCQLAAFGEAFDGVNGFAGNLRREREAASRRAAVDQHGAGAADAVLAAEMRSGQLHLLTQKVGEMLARLYAAAQRPAVQGRLDCDLVVAQEIIGAIVRGIVDGIGHAAARPASELSTRRVSTAAMCSLVSARTPAVSSGARSARMAASKAPAFGSGVARPSTAADTDRASCARSTQPKYAIRALPMRSRCMVATAARPTSAKSPWRRASSAKPILVPVGMTGNLTARISSPACRSVSNRPVKKSSAFTARSPLTLPSTSVAPSTTAQAGSSAAGSA